MNKKQILQQFKAGSFHVKWSRKNTKCNPPSWIFFKFSIVIDLELLVPKNIYFWKSDNPSQSYVRLKIVIFVIAQAENFVFNLCITLKFHNLGYSYSFNLKFTYVINCDVYFNFANFSVLVTWPLTFIGNNSSFTLCDHSSETIFQGAKMIWCTPGSMTCNISSERSWKGLSESKTIFVAYCKF